MTPYSQSDPTWGHIEIVPGDNSSRLSRIGCAVTVIAEASKRLTGGTVTPGTLVKMGRDAGAFLGKLVVWQPLGKLVGVDCTIDEGWVRNTRDSEVLKRAIKANMSGLKAMCILHVDRDEKDDDWRGDHYVLAIGLTDEVIYVADPAGGTIRELDFHGLVGASPRGAHRPYRVRGVMPVKRLAV
jgi:hypothetical protein